jgi:hypothetical protein
MKKNYIQPNIKMAIAMDAEVMTVASTLEINRGGDTVSNPDEILSRRNNSVWGDDEEE